MPQNNKLFFVRVRIDIEYTYYYYNRTYVFNSENAMNKFMEKFHEKGYTLRKIVDYGEAGFNKDGILWPYD